MQSTQILSTLAQGPYSETVKIVQQTDSELGQAYETLKSLFDQTKKIYSQEKPFLSANELSISEPEHRATIRTTNLATFVSSVFGGGDVGFYELNDYFIETFAADGGELSTDAGLLYLNFKTQMYISAVSQEEQERTKDEILEDLFPPNIEDILYARRPGEQLSESELDFVNEARARREYLLNEPSDVESIRMSPKRRRRRDKDWDELTGLVAALSEKYAWEDFLISLSAHLRDNYEPLLGPYMERHALTAPTPPPRASSQQDESSTILESFEPPLDQNGDLLQPQNGDMTEEDIIEQANRAAEEALQTIDFGAFAQDQPPPPPPPHQLDGRFRSLLLSFLCLHHLGMQQQMFHHQLQGGPGQNGYPMQQYAGTTIPYHTQTAPTQVLYEQARQAAVAKASPHSRRPGLPSQRRPWSTEEENALMAGLDQVRGPHWSQILALYGAKGQVSEILKDRNQVQLKDKARNLKLFFLKSNIEVPYYLQCVTGELKTRAPSQAARKEAEERARMVNEDEVRRFEGIMTLANGMHGQPQGPAGQGHMGMPMAIQMQMGPPPHDPQRSTPGPPQASSHEAPPRASQQPGQSPGELVVVEHQPGQPQNVNQPLQHQNQQQQQQQQHRPQHNGQPLNNQHTPQPRQSPHPQQSPQPAQRPSSQQQQQQQQQDHQRTPESQLPPAQQAEAPPPPPQELSYEENLSQQLRLAVNGHDTPTPS